MVFYFYDYDTILELFLILAETAKNFIRVDHKASIAAHGEQVRVAYDKL